MVKTTKSVTELTDQIAQLDKRANEIMAGYESEKRMANDAERKELGEIMSKRYRLNNDLADARAMEFAQGMSYRGAEEQFSLTKAIRSMVSGEQLNDATREVCQRAREEHSTSGANAEKSGIWVPSMVEGRSAMTAAANAGVIVDEKQQEMLFPLVPNLTMTQLGARMMTGLKGDIFWPSATDPDVFWEGENTAAKETNATYSKGKVYKPIRIAAFVDISDQLLLQENRSTEADLRNRIAVKLAQKLEATAFSKEKLSEYAPEGIFAQLESQVSGAMSWPNIVKFEELCDTENALLGNLGYAMHKSLLYKAKTEVKHNSGAGGFIFGNDGSNFINGYKAVRSGHIPAGLGADGDEYGIVFGNWADYFIGQWGSFNIKVDPYTQALQGVTRLIVTGYFNMGAIRPESFVVGSLK